MDEVLQILTTVVTISLMVLIPAVLISFVVAMINVKPGCGSRLLLPIWPYRKDWFTPAGWAACGWFRRLFYAVITLVVLNYFLIMLYEPGDRVALGVDIEVLNYSFKQGPFGPTRANACAGLSRPSDGAIPRLAVFGSERGLFSPYGGVHIPESHGTAPGCNMLGDNVYRYVIKNKKTQYKSFRLARGYR